MNDLATVLVHCNLRKMLDDWFKDDSAALLCFHELQTLLEDMISTDVADKREHLVLLESFIDQVGRLLGCLSSFDALFKKDLQCSCTMHVDGDLAEVLLDGFKNLLDLTLRGLLEEHLAQEVSERMHHQLVEGCVLIEKLVKHIFNELRCLLSILLLRQPGHVLGDLVLQYLTPVLVPRKEERLLNQVRTPSFFSR